MSRERPYREGLLFDTNTLFLDKDRARFSDLCKLLASTHQVRCWIPAPALAELLRNISARIHDSLRAAGVLASAIPYLDPRDELPKLEPAQILPFEPEDAFALLEWTERTYGTQAEFGRYKARLAVTNTRKLFSRALFEHKKSPFSTLESIERDNIWSQVVELARKMIDQEKLSPKMRVPTTTDWLIIGTALRHDLVLVTNETARENEFRDFRKEVRRVITLENLKTEIGFS